MPKYRHANCMGYALHKNMWMSLRAWERFVDVNEEYEFEMDLGTPADEVTKVTRQETNENIIEEMAEYGLTPIKREDMRPGQEYIAIKYSMYDFHVMRRNIHGYWRHKPGSMRIRDVSEDKVFASKWKNDEGDYSSQTLLFKP